MKRIIIFALALALLAIPALAANMPLVVDEADLLTDAQEQTLLLEAERISGAYSSDVVILTVNELGGKEPMAFADDSFDYNGYGQGENRDGILLVLSMAERDWAISTRGAAIAAFTDYAQEEIMNDVKAYLADDNYAGGFARYLRDVEMCLQQASEGAPYDVKNPIQLTSLTDRLLGTLPIWLILAAVVTLVGILVMLSGMKTARKQFAARDYVRGDSMDIRRSQDIFLYRTTVRAKIERSEGSGGGGGSSTHTSSSGATHGGSSGKF